MLRLLSVVACLSVVSSYKIFSDKITVRLGKEGVQSIEKISPVTGKRSKLTVKKRGKGKITLIKTEEPENKKGNPYNIPEEYLGRPGRVEGISQNKEKWESESSGSSKLNGSTNGMNESAGNTANSQSNSPNSQPNSSNSQMNTANIPNSPNIPNQPNNPNNPNSQSNKSTANSELDHPNNSNSRPNVPNESTDSSISGSGLSQLNNSTANSQLNHLNITNTQPISFGTSESTDRKNPSSGNCLVIKTVRRISSGDAKKLKGLVESRSGHLKYVYKRIFNGISVCNLDLGVVDELLSRISNSRISAEKNSQFSLSYRQENLPDNFYVLMNTHKSLFGLLKIDQLINRYLRNGYILRKSRLFKWYRNRYQALISNYTGKGVEIEVIDEDVSLVHWEIEGRVRVERVREADFPSSHPTAVMTAAGGRTTGLGKRSHFILHPVFRFGLGYLDDILGVLDGISVKPGDKKIILLPFAGDKSEILDESLKMFYLMNIPVVVAAGNSSGNACDFSPGRSKYVITIGSSSDVFLPEKWTNSGVCVDSYAPGKATVGEISRSVGIEYTEKEGSSISAGYTAGYISLLLESREITIAEIKEILKGKGKTPLVDIPNTGEEREIIESRFDYSNITVDCLLIISPVVAVVASVIYRKRGTVQFTRSRSRFK